MTDNKPNVPVVAEAKLLVQQLEDGTVRIKTDYSPEPSTFETNEDEPFNYPLAYEILDFAARTAVAEISGVLSDLENAKPPTDAVN